MNESDRALLAPLVSTLAGRAAGIPADPCYATSPDRLKACARERGHGVTAMTLPNGRRTYVAHNARHDGSGEGWS